MDACPEGCNACGAEFAAGPVPHSCHQGTVEKITQRHGSETQEQMRVIKRNLMEKRWEKRWKRPKGRHRTWLHIEAIPKSDCEKCDEQSHKADMIYAMI
mmetsp:Transcript_40868/g.64372  ORF Transcript_40868/g.64372 Transcript_40868/m.64372 type:complete len:99 (-) Transcript_40868:258-554(-)